MNNPIYKKFKKILKLDKLGMPTIVKPEYYPLWDAFIKTLVAKSIKSVYKDPMQAQVVTAALFISHLHTLKSNPTSSSPPYRPEEFSILLLKYFATTFPKLLGPTLKKMLFNKLLFGNRFVRVTSGYNKFLNSHIYPNVTVVQMLTVNGNLDQALSAIKHYSKLDPSKLKTSNFKVAAKNLTTLPIYNWTYFTTISGIKFFLYRYDKNVLALRLEFDLPFILTQGNEPKRVMELRIIKMLKNIKFGV